MAVLQRKELEQSPLADLHVIAAELGVEGYRTLRKPELIEAIVAGQGGEAADEDEEEAPGPDESSQDQAAPDEPAEEEEPQPEPAREEQQRSGILDILGNGSGFVRAEPSGHSPDDVYVSPAQIRRCELRAGDEISGPVRPPRRSERHPSMVRIEQVNGAPAEPPQERPRFQELTAVFPTERLSAPPALQEAPFGKGSRVAVTDAPGGHLAGATGSALRAIAATLADAHSDLDLAVLLVGIRPEEVTEWRRDERLNVIGDGADRAPDALGQVAELAVERAKRRVERGEDAVLMVDSLAAFPAGTQRRIFGAARNVEQGGSLTVVAATGPGPEVDRLITTRITLAPTAGPEPELDGSRSGTLRADLLA